MRSQTRQQVMLAFAIGMLFSLIMGFALATKAQRAGFMSERTCLELLAR